METFVFLHEQQILIDFKKTGKFENIDNLKFVFLGNNPYDQIENLEDVIIARNYSDNIEEWNKNLLAYSGWYLLWKNNLINSNFVNLLEYDILIDPNFSSIVKENIKTTTKYIGYVPLITSDYWFLSDPPICVPLLGSIKKHYDIDFIQYMSERPVTTVNVTTNQSMSIDTFNSFMKWMEPILEDIKEEKFAGHMPERSFPLFCLYNNLEGILLSDILKHYQMNTHMTHGDSKLYMGTNYDDLIKK